jgi:hypothetical protein
MNLPKLKKGDPVIVTWLDVYDPTLPAWASDDEIMEILKRETKTATSRGFYYTEFCGYLVIYADYMDGQYSRLTAIPVGAIKKIKKG